MSWFASSSPIGRRVTFIAVASLLGIGCVTFIILLKRKAKCKSKKKKREKDAALGKRHNSAALESEIILHLAKENAAFMDKVDGGKLASDDVIDNLLVTTAQLEIMLKDITAIGTLDTDKIASVKERLECLEKILNEILGKASRHQRKVINKGERLPVKYNEKLLEISNSERAFIGEDNDDNLSMSSDDSFVSATESIPDEDQLEEIIYSDGEVKALILQYGHINFYNEGITAHNRTGINVRKLRTELLGCQNDADFLIKVYCIRRAFEVIFQNVALRDWFLHTGHRILTQFLATAGKDCAAFEREFNVLVMYCQDANNWGEIEEELKERGVCCMSFYDIVLDFIIMDSFDDLANPPYALTSVIQNGWISNSIKETALSASVWSLLTAKMRMLQNPDAFMAKFYQVSQYLTPVLVWGFLGPAGSLKDSCHSFKEVLVGFLQDIFSLDRCDYYSVDTLADSIVKNAKARAQVNNEEKS